MTGMSTLLPDIPTICSDFVFDQLVRSEDSSVETVGRREPPGHSIGMADLRNALVAALVCLGGAQRGRPTILRSYRGELVIDVRVVQAGFPIALSRLIESGPPTAL